MRIVLSAIIVCAVVLMIGCGTSAADKATMQAQADQIKTLKEQVTNLQKKVTELTNAASTPAQTTPPTGTKPEQPAKATTPGKTK